MMGPRPGFPGSGGPNIAAIAAMCPPVATTVYVGKIAPTVPDEVILELLEACGQIKKWNPVKEPSGQSKGFGFCEYVDGEGALRSLRLLNNLKIDGQELLLKPNTATQKYLVW
jgi:RNA-binding protein 25